MNDKQAACPICSKSVTDAYRPFCSKRCADIDLSRWLKGIYVIPGKSEDDEAGESGDKPTE
jgi:endogenous inhibitor of DNA gyrase (YacG/DUF329 family)